MMGAACGMDGRLDPDGRCIARRLAALGWTDECVRPHTVPHGSAQSPHSRTRSQMAVVHTQFLLAVLRRSLVGGGAQDFADFAGQALEGEGLLQESFLAVGGGGAGESVL